MGRTEINWVSGIRRGKEGKLCVEVQDAEGRRSLTSLESLQPSLNGAGSIRRKVCFSLGALREVASSDYLEPLGLERLDPGAQRIYEVSADGATLIVPSQLLVLGLFGEHAATRALLFTPRDPSDLVGAHREGKACEFVSNPNRGRRLRKSSLGLLARLTWMSMYPSANAAWSSVYTNALAGIFDFRPASADVTVSASGRMHNGKLLVTSIRMLELRATDAPFDFATPGAPQDFVLTEMIYRHPTHRLTVAPSQQLSIAKQGVVEPLTDEQWSRVEPILKRVRWGGERKHSLRALFDAIRLKYGAPYSWPTLPLPRKFVQVAQTLASDLKKAGAWDELMVASDVVPVEGEPTRRTGRNAAPLSDDEWSAVEEQVLELFVDFNVCDLNCPRRHSLRSLLDIMRLKVIGKHSWRSCPAEQAAKQSAQVLLSKIQRAGAWPRLCRLLGIEETAVIA